MKAFNGLVFPEKHSCLFCKENNIIGNRYICKDCYENLEVLNKEVKIDSPYIKKTYYAVFYNRFIRERIKEYKYHGKNYLYRPFGAIMIETIRVHNIDKDIDIILYIPIHRRKKALRGYNQSELLAEYMAKNLNKPLLKNCLIKSKWTKEQSHSNKIDRLMNLRDSFTIKDASGIKGKRILLIDDIVTTGTTLEECSRVIINNGAKEIICLALTSTKDN